MKSSAQSVRFVRDEIVPFKARPVSDRSLLARLRYAFFSGIGDSLLTVITIVVLAVIGTWLARWAVFNAVLLPGTDALARCRAAEGVGACWPVIAEKWRLILFGLYPFDAQWRPAAACAVIMGVLTASAIPRFWRPSLVAVWLAGAILVALLIWGGVGGLQFVPSDQWGGLLVTLLLSSIGLICGFPLGILLALARRAVAFPSIKGFALAYIELARAIPLLAVLFMASVMFPLFLPQDVSVSKLLRVQIAIALFAAAYLAEVIRGGLQAIPRGQEEAADAIGLGYWKKTIFIILPQALRISIPGIVNTFISFFKATSIVVVVGIFDIMTATKRAIADPQWQGFGFELYLFVGALYFVICFSMSRYSRWLEFRLKKDR